MASKEGTAGQAFGPILAAVATMQGNVPRSEKTNAHEFLEKFQKSVSEPPLLRVSWYICRERERERHIYICAYMV